jgi:hypothetical protein
MTNRDTATTEWNAKTVLKIKPHPVQHAKSCDVTFDHPEIDGFGIRFRRPTVQHPWGKGTYAVRFTKGKRDRRMSLDRARVGAIDYAVARKRALDILDDARDPHKDPVAERRKARNAHSQIFSHFVPAYISHMRLQNLSEEYINKVEGYLKNDFPDLYDMPVKMIEQPDVATALGKILNRNPDDPTPIAMRLARSALSTFFKWLMQEGKASFNPVAGTTSYISEEGDRVLTPAELAIVWNAATPDWEFGRQVRLLILTGARKQQIGSLQKRMVVRNPGKDDHGYPVPQIVLPKRAKLRTRRNLAALGKSTKRKKASSKNKLEFRIPLSKQALALFDMQPDRKDSDYVFGVEKCGATGSSGSSQSMTALRKRIGNKFFELRGLDPDDEEAQAEVHWSLQDLRRTFSTLVTKHCYIAPGIKVQPHIADAAINHKPKVKIASDVEGVYNHNDYLEDRIPIMQLWADYVDSLVKPKLKVVAKR